MDTRTILIRFLFFYVKSVKFYFRYSEKGTNHLFRSICVVLKYGYIKYFIVMSHGDLNMVRFV